MSPLPQPGSAEPRPDLGFLRHRGVRRTAAESAVSSFIGGQGGHGPHHHATRTVAPAPVAPVAPPPAAPGPAPGSDALDLSVPVAPPSPPSNTPPAAPPMASTGLDLSTPTAPVAAPQAAAPRPRRSRPRIIGTQQHILGVRSAAVWLTRVQSGIGELSVEAVCGPDVGDLRLGALYQLASGPTSTVQLAGGNRFAPSSRRPVIVAGRDDYEHLRLDLRQNRELVRLAVYAFSESRTELIWGGTLVVETVAGGRIEVPLETLQPGRIAVLLSVYNVDGELVVRAEMETLDGDVREAARAYGYDRITWRDDRSPVD